VKICKICLLPKTQRTKIDAALLEGVPYKGIVAKFGRGKFSYGAVGRHRRHVLPKDLMRKAPPPPPESGRTLVERIEGLVHEVRYIATAAQNQQQWVASTTALREVRCCLELLGKLSGEISAGGLTLNFVNGALSEEQLCAVLDAVKKRGPEAVKRFVRLANARLDLGLEQRLLSEGNVDEEIENLQNLLDGRPPSEKLLPGEV